MLRKLAEKGKAGFQRGDAVDTRNAHLAELIQMILQSIDLNRHRRYRALEFRQPVTHRKVFISSSESLFDLRRFKSFFNQFLDDQK